jgi:hypothetical protein
MGRSLAALTDKSQARMEETGRDIALDDGSQFACVQPHAFAAWADVNFHRAAFLRGQFLTAFRAMHPVRFLEPEFFRIGFRLLLLGQYGHSDLQFLHPDMFVFVLAWFHEVPRWLRSPLHRLRD